MDDLVQRLNDALKLQCHQQANFDSLTSALPAEDIEFWEHLCRQWHNAPNPKYCIFNPFLSISPVGLMESQILRDLETSCSYECFDVCLSKSQAKLFATGEEPRTECSMLFLCSLRQLRQPQAVWMLGLRRYLAWSNTSFEVGVSPVDFILLGLHLSKVHEQLFPSLEEDSSHSPSLFLRRLGQFRELQQVYMPGLRRYLDNDPTARDGEDNDRGRMELWFPSDIRLDLRHTVCDANVVEIEERIREARCFDLLALIRHNLRVKTRMPQILMGRARDQHYSQSSGPLTERILTQVKDIAKEYRRNRDALVCLRGPGQWEEALQEIGDCDVQMLDSKRAEVVKAGSWIWGTASVAMENNVLLREEWCRRWLLVQTTNAKVERLLEELSRVV